jgi:hypothetical protein
MNASVKGSCRDDRPSLEPGAVKLGLSVALCGALAALGGCSVGSGSGSTTGPLFVVNCDNGNPFGKGSGYVVAPKTYDLTPTFFAGSPVDDLMRGPGAMNKLYIELASSGLLQRYTDGLEFLVQNSYEVARCVRGRTVNGQPDFLVNEPLPLTLATTATPPPTTLWCDWTGMAFSDGGAPDAATPGAPEAGASLDGGMSMTASAPRIHLTPYTDIRTSLWLFKTCPSGNDVGSGIDGWIQFQSFGSAEETDLPPDQRSAVLPDFVIADGDRLRASFHVLIGDPRFVTAVQYGTTPPTAAIIGGALDGYFDFDFARGRGLQPFP